METDMGVEAKGFSAEQNKAAVRGVSGVLGSPIDHKKISQLLSESRSASAWCNRLRVWGQLPVQALHSDRNGQVGQFMGLGAG